jgi:hypothetical protein
MGKGIIYAILDEEYFYIGSTTKSIEERIQQHKYHKESDMKLYKYINEIRGGWTDILYIILEEIEYKTHKELREKEYEYIKKHYNNKCLNLIQNDKQMYSLITKRRKLIRKC